MNTALFSTFSFTCNKLSRSLNPLHYWNSDTKPEATTLQYIDDWPLSTTKGQRQGHQRPKSINAPENGHRVASQNHKLIKAAHSLLRSFDDNYFSLNSIPNDLTDIIIIALQHWVEC